MIEISWLGNLFIVLGLWYQAKKHWWAFLFSVVGESLWIAYAITAHIWSLAVVCAIFAILAIRAMVAWRNEAMA